MDTFDALKELCAMRHSVRFFDEHHPLRMEDIERVIEIATLAPSVENIQPWRFHIISNPSLRGKLMETACYGNFVVGASVFIVVTCNTGEMTRLGQRVWKPEELEYSCIAAMNQLLLAATALDIGTCWVSLHSHAAHMVLNLPSEEKVIGGLMLGRMKEDSRPASTPHDRKPLASVITVHN